MEQSALPVLCSLAYVCVCVDSGFTGMGRRFSMLQTGTAKGAHFVAH